MLYEGSFPRNILACVKYYTVKDGANDIRLNSRTNELVNELKWNIIVLVGTICEELIKVINRKRVYDLVRLHQ